MVTPLPSKSLVADPREAGRTKEEDSPVGQRDGAVPTADIDVDDRWWLWRRHLMPQELGTAVAGRSQCSVTTIASDHLSSASNKRQFQSARLRWKCDQALGEAPACLFSCWWLRYSLIIAESVQYVSGLHTASNLPPHALLWLIASMATWMILHLIPSA